MRIHAAVYVLHDQPDTPLFLGAESAAMVEHSPERWRMVLTQEAPDPAVAAIAELVLEVPDGAVLDVLRTAPPVISCPVSAPGQTAS